MSYETVEVNEKTFESIVSINSDKIEKGLRYLDHQKRTERGPLDVLFVDSGNALVVAELKVVEEDNMLVQGIDYYEDVTKNIESLCRIYNKISGIGIDPTQKPRLFLMAPSFSINLLKRSSWIDVPISLFSYKCIKVNGTTEILPVFNEVTIPGRIQPMEVYTIEQRLNYIQDDKVKESFKKLLEDVKKYDDKRISIDPVKYDVSVKVSGKVIAYFCPRRKNYIVYTFDTDSDWTGFQVNSETDIPPLLELIRLNYEKFKK
ncbi:MAG: hypothetical protein M0P74_16275 [Syntrophales bacterium]|jgi:hypothetical protein|nr:hypothetical protein [Syntrophales bacterium]